MEKRTAKEAPPQRDHAQGDGVDEGSVGAGIPGILIVTRNGLALSKLALKTALAQDVPAQVLVVDNASTDGTMTWLLSKNVYKMLLRTQRSLAECWNMGLKALWKAGAPAVLVINNDVQLRPDTLRLLLSHGGPFVTCVSTDEPGRVEVSRLEFEQAAPLDWRERPHPDFSCFLIRKSVTDKVGWFDEGMFPAYAEDSDMHVRMHRAGIHAVCIDLPFLHSRGSTLRQADLGEAARIKRGADANRERFRLKYGCLPGSTEYRELFRMTDITQEQLDKLRKKMINETCRNFERWWQERPELMFIEAAQALHESALHCFSAGVASNILPSAPVKETPSGILR